jgi:DNA-binding NarL/FixJ family response regulator
VFEWVIDHRAAIYNREDKMSGRAIRMRGSANITRNRRSLSGSNLLAVASWVYNQTHSPCNKQHDSPVSASVAPWFSAFRSGLNTQIAMNVLMVDGHPFVHDVLVSIVCSVLGDVRLRTARSLEGCSPIVASEPKPDLVLLDLDLPGCGGIESLRRFRSICPAAPVVVLSANDSRATILAAFKAGAIGYLPKTLTRKAMVAALHVVAAGSFFVPYEALGDELSAPDRASKTNGADGAAQLGLTHRQYEVLQLIQRGYNNRKIARQLEISEGTVKQHVHAMFSTLGVSSRTEAIAAASRLSFTQE